MYLCYKSKIEGEIFVKTNLGEKINLVPFFPCLLFSTKLLILSLVLLKLDCSSLHLGYFTNNYNKFDFFVV